MLVDKLGFMQGRLSPIVDGKIQSFPWETWRDEFRIAFENNWNLIEWTLDAENLYQNPLMTDSGKIEIRELCHRYKIDVHSLTADFFMQEPFFKQKDRGARDTLLKNLLSVIDSTSKLGIKIIVLPLVDNSSVESQDQENILIEGLTRIKPILKSTGVNIAFESDLRPKQLALFIQKLDKNIFGINYDIGNSASLGYSYKEEFSNYFDRIMNVHIKDRKLYGTTVPLGEGDANINEILEYFEENNYRGNYILQAARSSNNRHIEILNKYREFVKKVDFYKL